jgi:hypothetical protein
MTLTIQEERPSTIRPIDASIRGSTSSEPVSEWPQLSGKDLRKAK